MHETLVAPIGVLVLGGSRAVPASPRPQTKAG